MNRSKLLLFCFLPLVSFGQVQVGLLNAKADEFDVFYVGRNNVLRITQMTKDMQITGSKCGFSFKKINDSTIDISVTRAGTCQLIVNKGGRMIGAWQFKAKFPNGFLTQKLKALRTDKDCLEFITRHLEDQEDFYFDTIFTPNEVKDLNLSYRNWGVFDFNNDQKPDLWFVGRYKGQYWRDARLYLSENDGYKESNLLRMNGGQYQPLVFSRQLYGKSLLFVYLFDMGNHTITDSLTLLRKDLYPEGIRKIDTLVYKYNNTVNYAHTPSNTGFDSIFYRCIWNQSCQGYSYTIYKDGRFKYALLRCGQVLYEKTGNMPDEKFKSLQAIIRDIDLANTKRDHTASWTDLSAARTTIFNGDQQISFNDYGMESSFTLMALYDLLAPVKQDEFE